MFTEEDVRTVQRCVLREVVSGKPEAEQVQAVFDCMVPIVAREIIAKAVRQLVADLRSVGHL